MASSKFFEKYKKHDITSFTYKRFDPAAGNFVFKEGYWLDHRDGYGCILCAQLIGTPIIPDGMGQSYQFAMLQLTTLLIN